VRIWCGVPGLVVLIVAAAAAAVAGLDRLLAAIAVRRIAARVTALTGADRRPVVRFAGAAFVPQLVTGTYSEIEVIVPACSIGGIEFCALFACLSLVRAPLRLLLRGRGLVAGQVSARATIPFAAIAGRLPAGLAVRRHGAELRVCGSVLRLPVSGTLAVTADGQRISVVPRVLGVPSMVGFVLALPGLPRELTIDLVRVTDAGLDISMRGDEVKLTPR